MFKTFGLQVRRDGFSHQDYVDHWLNVHAPMCEPVKALRGYVANEIIQASPLPGVTVTHPAFGATLDGVAQLHVETQDGLARLAEAPEVQAWFSDGPNFVGQRTGFLTKEHVLRSPGAPRLPYKAIAFVHAGGADLAAAFAAIAADWNGGLVLSTIDTITGSTNLPGFEVPPVDAAVEMWGDSSEQAVAMAAALSRTLPAPLTLVSVLIAREYVIRTPVQ
jgi:hypothetical protein